MLGIVIDSELEPSSSSYALHMGGAAGEGGWKGAMTSTSSTSRLLRQDRAFVMAVVMPSQPVRLTHRCFLVEAEGGRRCRLVSCC